MNGMKQYRNYYEAYPDVISNENGIVIRKIIGKEKNLFIAEMIFKKNATTIAFAETEEDIKEKINHFTNAMQNVILLKNTL